MQYQAFKQFIHSISTLTAQQKNILRDALSGSESYKLWGLREGRWCRSCSRTCNAFTGTPLARLRHPDSLTSRLPPSLAFH